MADSFFVSYIRASILWAFKIIFIYLSSCYAKVGLLLVPVSWIITAKELVKLIWSSLQFFTRRQSQSNLSPRTKEKNEAPSIKLFSQFASLSLLSMLNAYVAMGCYMVAAPSTIIIFSSLGPIFNSIITSTYLQFNLISSQKMAIIIQASCIIAVQWDACLQAPIEPLWVYTLLLVNLFLNQLCTLWEESIEKYSTTSLNMQNLLKSFFGIVLGIWSIFFVPTESIFISDSTINLAKILRHDIIHDIFMNSYVQIAGLIIIGATLELLFSKFTIVPGTQLNIPPSFISICSLAFAVFVIDHYYNIAYLDVTIAVGAIGTFIALSIFLVSIEEQNQPTQLFYYEEVNEREETNDVESEEEDDDSMMEDQKPQKKVSKDHKIHDKKRTGGIIRTMSMTIPDFILHRCRIIHCFIALITLIILIVIFSNTGTSESLRSYTSPITSPIKNNTIEPIIPYDPPSEHVSSIQFFTNFFLPSGISFDWKNRLGDENLDLQDFEQIFWRKRNPSGEKLFNKDVAVCLAGNINQTWSQDLEWQYQLYRSVGSYDLFVWLNGKSIPYGTRSLKQTETRWTNGPWPSTPIYRKWKSKRTDIEQWYFYVWGMGECIDMIRQYSNHTGVKYKSLLIAQPTLAFEDQSLGQSSQWTNQTYFWPQLPNSYYEESIYGPFDTVAHIIKEGYAQIGNWTGAKTTRDYLRNFAQHSNFSIVALPKKITQIV